MQGDTPSGEGLYRRLVWLTLFRIALVTVLLGMAAAVVLKSDVTDLGRTEQVLYGLILFTYAVSLGYLLVLRKAKRFWNGFAYVQISGDVLIAACLVYLTGGAESIVVFMFPLTVVSAAVLLYRRGAIVAAVLSSAASAAITIGLNSGFLPPASPSLAPPAMPVANLAFILFAHASAIFLAAALASYLAEQVRAARERLSLREHDYLALEILHESIVRSVAGGIITIDRFGRITFVNPAAERLSGLSQRTLLGEAIETHFPGLKGRLIDGLPPGRFEDRLVTPEGVERWLGFTVAPLLDGAGKNYGCVVLFEDLTSIRAMEETVRRSERLAAIGGMAAGLAHELRNPLASMSGSIQLLSESKVFGDDDQKLMRIVLRETDRLNGLVTDFLRFARPAPLQLSCFDLSDMIATTVGLFGNDPSRKGIEVRQEIEDDLIIDADRGQLGQVLWNLLANASEAMSGGGTIWIKAKKRADLVELRVVDEGEGIKPENLQRVFDPFFTTKDRGTGLGLATVHGIVRAHRGDVTVVSQVGKGTTFTVVLPSREGENERKREAGARDQSDDCSPCIAGETAIAKHGI